MQMSAIQMNRRDAEMQRGNKNSSSLLFSAPLRLYGGFGNGSWLPDMDLNHDKQIQSLLCYRYTIGQAGAETGYAFPSLSQAARRETPS